MSKRELLLTDGRPSMNFLRCCRCGHHTRKFSCPKCKHMLCCSCGDPDPTFRKRRRK